MPNGENKALMTMTYLNSAHEGRFGAHATLEYDAL